MSESNSLDIGSTALAFETCVFNGRPVCTHPQGFRCTALRPKVYNDTGALVHYCGLGEHKQKPLRALNSGVVYCNKACPLHRSFLASLKSVGSYNTFTFVVDPMEIDASQRGLMEADIADRTTGVRYHFLDSSFQDLCGVGRFTARFPDWKQMFFHKVNDSNSRRDCIFVTKRSDISNLIKTSEAVLGLRFNIRTGWERQ